jgi:cell division protein FtsL
MAIPSKKIPSLVTDLRPHIQKQSIWKRFSKTAKVNLKKVVAVLIAIGIILLIYGYLHTREELNKLSNATTANQNETQTLVNKVAKLVELPDNDVPTIATVSNANKLKSQQFFERAENGDKVLIYSKSGWAVLYRPSTNKVIVYSKVNLNSQQ